MTYLLIPALAGTLFLVGCTGLMQTTAPVVDVSEKTASIVVRTQVQPGGYRTMADPRLTINHIDHIVLSLYELVNGQEVEVRDEQGEAITHDLTRANLGSLITFSKLKPQTTYRIKAAAYKAPGTNPADLISTTDATSFVDVAVTDDDRPFVTTLKVKLMDVVFDGQATFNGVVVTPGGYLPTGPVTISIEPGDENDDDLLNEGTPAHQGMIDLYVPSFTEGMTWTYRIAYRHPEGTREATKSVLVTNVGAPLMTVTTTITWDDEPDNPVVGTTAATVADWLPPATALRELDYDPQVFKGELLGDVPVFAYADNTPLDRAYVWLAHGIGIFKTVVITQTPEGDPIEEEELLVDFHPWPLE